jgi:ribulose 1,5-bisphosphate synthetase/thiazole synthase
MAASEPCRSDRVLKTKENQEAETSLHGESSNNNGAPMLSKVMIVGAGTGGLCLAQRVKQSGIDVSVFERDRTPTDGLQGYRLHIS